MPSEFGNYRAQDVIVIPRRGRLFVDKADNRGQAVLRANGSTQPGVVRIWRSLMTTVHPDTVLDIGANYGEIGLTGLPPHTTETFLFEPNPAVRKHLCRSVSTFNRRICVSEAAISSKVGEAILTVDKKWSGTSSLVGAIPDSRFKGTGQQSYEACNVPVATIDSFLESRNKRPRRLLFKIDVEGNEALVLDGMNATLSEASMYAGIVEFDKEMTVRAGIPWRELFDRLNALGEIKIISRNGLRTARREMMPEHCDVLISRFSRARHLPQSWPNDY